VTAPFEWMMALRYLKPRRREGFISVIAIFSLLGIAIGVWALIVVMSVMNGFRDELWSRILGLNGHVVVESFDKTRPITNYDSLAERIRLVNGVKSAIPIIEGQAMALAGQQNSGAVVRGIEPADLKANKMVADNIVEGSLDDFQGRDVVVIGERLARQLGVKVGDQITLVSPEGTATAFGTAPRMISYYVAATFEIGMSEYDSTFVFMPLKEAQIYFKLGAGVNAIEIKLNDPDHAESVIAPIRAQAPPDTYIASWQKFQSSLFNALEVERNVMFLILTLIIVVAAFNIISSLIMLVQSKSSDIGILRTMGASRGAIMRIFLISGSSIGVLGTTIGLVLGVITCLNMESIRQLVQNITGTQVFDPELYFLSQLPAEMSAGEIATVVMVALVLSVLATLPPSWRAARLDPVEALRYE
jgi:lipoprotein-releasing system permease protein